MPNGEKAERLRGHYLNKLRLIQSKISAEISNTELGEHPNELAGIQLQRSVRLLSNMRRSLQRELLEEG